jgi:hypothetical protein
LALAGLDDLIEAPRPFISHRSIDRAVRARSISFSFPIETQLPMTHNLTYSTYTARVLNATAAGTTAVPTSSIQITNVPPGGGKGVRFVVLLGAIAASGSAIVKLQTSPDNATWTDVAGSSNGSAAYIPANANEVVIREVYLPPNVYVRADIDRTGGPGNVTIDGAIAEVFNLASVPPPAQDATVADFLVQNQPANGTA